MSDRAFVAETTPRAPANDAVDVHAHFLPLAGVDALARPDLIESLAGEADDAARLRLRGAERTMPRALVDLDAHVRDMDVSGVDVRYLSPPPFTFFYDLPRDEARAWSRSVNDAMIDAAAGVPERFRPVGTLPMAHPDEAVAELERLADRGLALVEIGTNVLGAGLHESAFRPVLRAAAQRGVALLLHPDGVDGRYADERWHLRNLVGNPFETAYAAAQLASAGVLDELPDLRVFLSHGGGALPQLAGRIDHAAGLRADVPLAPSSVWMPRFYYDSIVFSRAALDALVAIVGPTHVCYGTDAPFDMSEPLSPAARFAHFAEPDRRSMSGGTARDLLAAGPVRPTTLKEDA